MNKRYLTIGIAALCLAASCFVGCAPETEQSVGEKIPAPYTEADLETVTFYDKTLGVTVGVSDNTSLSELLLSVEYYAPSQVLGAGTDILQPNYVLSIGDTLLNVYSASSIGFLVDDGATETRAVTKGKEFSYVETLLGSGAVSFENYSSAKTVEVFDTKNDGGELSNKSDFLENLQRLKFVKLHHKADYAIGEKAYTVKIDEEELLFYEKYAVVRGELYILYEGNFEFFKTLKYSSSSSGWLPWI